MPHVAEYASLDLLDPEFAEDLVAAIQSGIAAGIIFPCEPTVEAVFRSAVQAAGGAIDKRYGSLLRDFLVKGPYPAGGEIPPDQAGKVLSDKQTARVLSCMQGYMITHFKGALAELLSLPVLVRILNDLKERRAIPSEARLYLGDTVTAYKRNMRHFAKAPDAHILTVADGAVTVHAVAEIKSDDTSEREMLEQLRASLPRLCQGTRVCQVEYLGAKTTLVNPLFVITVRPSTWTLPRLCRVVREGERMFFFSDSPYVKDKADRLDYQEQHVRATLRWSCEALAASGFALTFRYMEHLGEILQAEGAIPEGEGMTPRERGFNRAQAMLYYGYMRAVTKTETDNALAIWNTFGFGFALGMSFRDKQGHRAMLTGDDLEEIIATGATRAGWRIRRSRSEALPPGE